MLGNREKYADVNEAFDVWKSYLSKMGYGEKLGVDLPSEEKGFIPNSKFYNKVLKRTNWNAHNIISIAIGQMCIRDRIIWDANTI